MEKDWAVSARGQLYVLSMVVKHCTFYKSYAEEQVRFAAYGT
jgi:hypothetical protein